MVNRRALWWLRTYTAASFVTGVSMIVASVLDHGAWWSWLPHLLVGVILVALAVFLFMDVGHGRQRKLKKRSLPPV